MHTFRKSVHKSTAANCYTPWMRRKSKAPHGHPQSRFAPAIARPRRIKSVSQLSRIEIFTLLISTFTPP